MACTERHFGVDYNVVAAFGKIVVKRAVDHAAVGHDDGSEIIFLPF